MTPTPADVIAVALVLVAFGVAARLFAAVRLRALVAGGVGLAVGFVAGVLMTYLDLAALGSLDDLVLSGAPMTVYAITLANAGAFAAWWLPALLVVTAGLLVIDMARRDRTDPRRESREP